jgi:hypothetical protein
VSTRPRDPQEAAPAGALRWTAENEFAIGEVSYVCRPHAEACFSSTADRFCIRKPPATVTRYQELLARLQPRTVVELGLDECGSTAMIAQLAELELLIGIDIAEQPNPGLSDFVERFGLEGSVSTEWGVDQGDAERVGRIVDERLGGAQLDLVIDDASHMLAESRRSFEALFPRLRPGGEYVLEDWAWAHEAIEVWPRRPALTLLVFELTIACAHHPEVVAAVEIDRAWTMIRRGEGQVPGGKLELASLLGERGRRILGALGDGSQPQPSRRRRWLR